MSDTFALAAFSLAKATPSHLGKSTTPPIAWRVEGDELVVILADGRKVRGPMPRVPVISVHKLARISPKAEVPLPSIPAPKTTSRHKQSGRHKQANRKA